MFFIDQRMNTFIALCVCDWQIHFPLSSNTVNKSENTQ